ncbi:hypothetical protein C8Q76DRAFT_624659 [Earliella scabrosa]|nr:hypothetical protein C8Q76DRAFT_624659 [Earliella scabrosa]
MEIVQGELPHGAAPELTPNPRRVTVEEVEDIEPGGLPKRPWVGEFPHDAGSILRQAKTFFEEIRDRKVAASKTNFAPFANREEWELASFLIRSGLSQESIEDYLTLPITRNRTSPSFHNKRSFLQKIDALPAGPEWICEQLEVVGDAVDEDGQVRTESLELWRGDPIECIRELIANPAFREFIRFAPEQLFQDQEGQGRIYDEAWTADWWWELQVRKEHSLLPPDATIAPVILSSDKTMLSRFSGDKQAWPVYLTIGNISKSVRRQPSKHATVLLGYIPHTKLECFTKERRALEGYRLFHECMRILLRPLVEAGKNGVEMTCADGAVRKVYPILSAYIADHPEQCLVTGCQENFCPKCTAHSSRLGEPVYSTMKEPDAVWETISAAARGKKPDEFKQQGLRLIDPFWRELPHCDIFSCITPDLLHQLHKGVFKDHTVSWATKCMDGGAEEVDRCFKAMPRHPMLRHFRRGISLVSQWTGTEYKDMERVFLGVLTSASDPGAVRAVRAVLDFIYYAHFHSHTDDSLAALESAWATFHDNKQVFIDNGARVPQHYNIPKLHSALHYPRSIHCLGTTNGYNTENTERLHIDYAKRGYNASNKKEYVKQMTTWLRRQEAVSRFEAYLAWTEPTSTPLHASSSTTSSRDDEDIVMEQADVAVPNSNSSTDTPYSVAKVPGLPGTSVHTLVWDFGCTDFVRNHENFLRGASRSRTLPVSAQGIHSGTRFAVYKRMQVLLPAMRQVSPAPVKDVIRATPGQPARLLIPASPAHFDTVLAREAPALGTSPSDPLAGLCVARVRAIFQLPTHYGSQFQHHPVAYVEWFTPFRQPDPETGMYKVSHSTRAHRRRSSIIPITQIVRSVHLIPIWGKAVDRTWTSDNVLDKCRRFYVNPYLCHHDFVLFKCMSSSVTS